MFTCILDFVPSCRKEHKLYTAQTYYSSLWPFIRVKLIAVECACEWWSYKIVLVCRAEVDSLVHLPPVRSACAPVAVQFTKLETDHLPARETREQEISSYKRKAQVEAVLNSGHICLPGILQRLNPKFWHLHHSCIQSDVHVLMNSKAHLQQTHSAVASSVTSMHLAGTDTSMPITVVVVWTYSQHSKRTVSTGPCALVSTCMPFCKQETRVSDDNVDMSERQPMFLKDRGDTRHRSGNFRAAINAYSKALEIDASLTVCYANRAASCLKAQEYRQAACGF